MTIIVGVRFKDSSKTYFFDPRDLEINQGDMVIVDTVRGPELAKVAHGRRDIPETEVVGELKPVIRHARQSDFESMHALYSKHQEVLGRCDEKVQAHGLPMKLIKAEYSFDGSRLTFYFIADQRVDFRMLVRDLAHTFKTRIELRQIGPRDEARLLGGVGPCGRQLCCATFLPDYAVVNIKMAKDQDLPLNPSKISGVCGRLLCCLSYEHQHYIDLRAQLPARGAQVSTPDGRGVVISINALQQMVVVRLASSGMEETYAVQQIYPVGDDAPITPSHAREHDDDETSDQPASAEFESRRLTVGDYEGIDDSDVLEALALLEEGNRDEYSSESKSSPGSKQRSSRRPRSSVSPRAKPRQARTGEVPETADPARQKPSSRSRKRSSAKGSTKRSDNPPFQTPRQSTDHSTQSTQSSDKGESRRPRRRRRPQ